MVQIINHGLSSNIFNISWFQIMVYHQFINQDHGLVVTTSRPHRLLWRAPAVSLKNTGSQPLEGLQQQRPYRARRLSGTESPGLVVKTGENMKHICWISWIRGPMVMLKFHRERVGSTLSKGKPCPALLSGRELQLIHAETKLSPVRCLIFSLGRCQHVHMFVDQIS